MSGKPMEVDMVLSVPATASTTTVGAAYGGFVNSDAIVLVATLTGMSASTLDLYIQESWDNVNWYDVAHFTQLAGGAAAAVTRVSVQGGSSTTYTVGTGTASSASPLLAAGKFCDGPWGPLLRLVSVTGAGVNGGAVTQTVRVMPWQQTHG